MPRDEQYYKNLFEDLIAQYQYKKKQRDTLLDFYNHLNQIISPLLGALGEIASGKIPPQHQLLVSVFLTAWNFVPTAGTYINKVFTKVANKYEEEAAKRLSVVLGNYTHKDLTASKFCYQAVIYHHARILNGKPEHGTLDALKAEVKSKANAIVALFLPKGIHLSVVHAELTSELVTQLMKSLNLSVEAYQKKDLALEQLGDYLAQQLIKVNDAPLTKELAFSGEFKNLPVESRYLISLDAVRLAQLAYEDKALIYLYAKQWGYKLHDKPWGSKRDNTQEFFYQFDNNNHSIVLANQDTVLCILNGAPGLGEIYSGYNGALDKLWNADAGLENFLSYYGKFPPKRFIFIGHSTGAVLALLAANRFAQIPIHKKHLDKLTVITFAQPRIAQALPADFAKNVYRFIHPNDPVPFMPAEALGYSHFGTAYSLPEDTEIFNWENSSEFKPKIFAIKESHSLEAYQSRLIEHARSHSNMALPTHLKPKLATATSHRLSGVASSATFISTGTLERLGDIVFRDTFTSQALSNQLDTLREFSQTLIKELYQTGGEGFSHLIRNSFARVELLVEHYTKKNNPEHILEAQRLNIWLKISAHQKQNNTLSNFFYAPNATRDITSETQIILGDASIAPLILIKVLEQAPNFSKNTDDLRCALTTQPLTQYLAQIEVLNFLVLVAKEKNDIWEVLFNHEELIDLNYLFNLVDADKNPQINDYILQTLAQLQTIQNEPILQELITRLTAAKKSNNILLPALEAVSLNDTLLPKMRLHALQIKQKLQLQPHVKETREQESKVAQDSEPTDIPNSALRVLAYEDHLALGKLALLAKDRTQAKNALIQAYRCIPKLSEESHIKIAQQTIIDELATIFLQEADETTDPWSKCLIYQEILRYDPNHPIATAQIFAQGFGDVWPDFAKRLASIASPITPTPTQEECDKRCDDGEILIQTPFNGTWVLTDKDAIKAFEDRKPIRGSVHKVAQLGSLYIKEDPGAVGLAFAAFALSRWLFLGLSKHNEWGFVPVQPAKVLRKGKNPIVIQLSPDVAGENLQELLNKDPDPESLKKIDSQQFSVLIIASILLNMYDARDANFILKNYKLTSVDNDNILGRNETESGILTAHILVKNLVFCLAQMQDKINPDVVNHLTHMNFSTLSRIRAWLYSLHHYNITIEANVFKDKADHKKYFERPDTNSKVILPVFFANQGILQPFTKLIKICSALKKNPTLSHQELFSTVRKELARYYAKSFEGKKDPSLADRLNFIGGLRGASVCTTTKLVTHTIGKSVKTHEEFVQLQHNPNEVLNLLKKLEKDEDLLSSIAEEISKGNMTTFADELGLQEVILAKLNATHYKHKEYTPKVHQAFLKALNPGLTRLVITGNPQLTDYELSGLINKMPNLESITLEDCPQLTGFVPGVLTSDWLTGLCKHKIQEIKLINCPQLSPELLKILPQLWKQYPAVDLDIPNPPTTWLSPDLVKIAEAYPQEKLLIPWLIYMAKRKAEELTSNHEEEVRRKSFDSDTASVTDEGQITIWDKNGLMIRKLTRRLSADYALAVTSDGDLLSDSTDEAMQRWLLSYENTYEDLLDQFRDTESKPKHVAYNEQKLTQRRQLRDEQVSLLFPGDLSRLGLSATPLADAFLVIHARHQRKEMSMTVALLSHPFCQANKLTLPHAAYDDTDAATLEKGLLQRILKQDKTGIFITELVIKGNKISPAAEQRLRSIIALNQCLMALKVPSANHHLRLPFMFADLAQVIITLLKDKDFPITSIQIDNIEAGAENLIDEINSLVAVNATFAQLAEQKSPVTHARLVTQRLSAAALNKLLVYLQVHPEIVHLDLICFELEPSATALLLKSLDTTHSHLTCNLNAAKVPAEVSALKSASVKQIKLNPNLSQLATELIAQLKANKMQQASVCLTLYQSRASVNEIEALLNKIFDDSTRDRDLFLQCLELPAGYAIADIPLTEHQLFAQFLCLPQGLATLKAAIVSTRFIEHLKLSRNALFASAMTENIPLFLFLLDLRDKENRLEDVQIVLRAALPLGKSGAFLHYTEERYLAAEQNTPTSAPTKSMIPIYSASSTAAPVIKYSKLAVLVEPMQPNQYTRATWLMRASRDLRWNTLDYGALTPAVREAFHASGGKPFSYDTLELLFKSGDFATYLYLEHLALLDLNLEPTFPVASIYQHKTLDDLLQVTDKNGNTYLHYLAANFSNSTAYKKTLIANAILWLVKHYDKNSNLRKIKNNKGEYPFELCDSVLLEYLYQNEKIDLSAGLQKISKHNTFAVQRLKQDLTPIVRGPLRLMLGLRRAVRLYFTEHYHKNYHYKTQEKTFLQQFNNYFSDYEIYLKTDLKIKLEPGKIYLAQSGKYQLLNTLGEVEKGKINTALIDLTNLAKKLLDPTFKDTILALTQKNHHGHTLKNLQETESALVKLCADCCNAHIIQNRFSNGLCSVIFNIIWHLDHGVIDHYQMIAPPTVNSMEPRVATASAKNNIEKQPEQEKEQNKQETEQNKQEKEAELTAAEAAEQKLQALLAQQATQPSTVVNAHDSHSSSSTSNASVSRSSSILPGLALAHESSRSTSPVAASSDAAADIDPDVNKNVNSIYVMKV